MNILIQNGRIIDPASALDRVGDLAISQGKLLALGTVPQGFVADTTIDAQGCIVMPGLVDVGVRIPSASMLQTELTAAVAGGVTHVVCQPDTKPVLDEPGLVEMLKLRAAQLQLASLSPLGALTLGLQGEVLTEQAALHKAGCIGFSQAEQALGNTEVLQRALQYAATYGFGVWLRPNDVWLGRGVVASGALATQMGLRGVPVAAETIALFTIFELVRATGARVHLCRLSSAAGVQLVRHAKAEGLPISCDVSINSLHLTEDDIGYYDSRVRLYPPLRSMTDRAALRQGLADGTIDALVSDHTPVKEEEKILPFAESTPGASGIELLLSLTLQWAKEEQLALPQALACISTQAAKIIEEGSNAGLQLGKEANICIFDPHSTWQVKPSHLKSAGKFTPFDFERSAMSLPGKVCATLVAGRLVYQA